MKYVLIMFSCFFFVFLPSSMCFSFELFLCFHLSLVMIQFDWKFAPCNRPARITERRGTKRQSIYIVEYVFFFFWFNQFYFEFYRFFVYIHVIFLDLMKAETVTQSRMMQNSKIDHKIPLCNQHCQKLQ